jgi:hypothetical protein
VRAIRTYLRETLSKASAHKLAEAGSANDRREALDQALGGVFGAVHEGLYVEDFGPDWVVFHVWSAGMAEGHYYRTDYAQDQSGITFGQPVEVERETTYVPADSSPAGAESASSATIASGKDAEGHGARLAEGDAAQRGADHHMKTVIEALNKLGIDGIKLAEGAGEADVLAGIMKLVEHGASETKRADTAESKVAEVEKAKRAGEVEVELAEIEKAGNLKPGEKAEFVLQAAEKPEVYAVRLADRKALKPNTIVDKAVHGSGDEGDSGSNGKRADVELHELAEAQMATMPEGQRDIVKATTLVLSENKSGIADRYRDFIEGREG